MRNFRLFEYGNGTSLINRKTEEIVGIKSLVAGEGVELSATSTEITVTNSAIKKKLVANNCRIPNNYNTIANWVHNCWTKHKSGPSGFSKGIYVTFLNGLISGNGEYDASYDFYLKVGMYINGKFYRGTWVSDNSTSTTLAKEWGVDTAYFAVAVPPNTEFYITNVREATDGGAAGSYNVITNTSGQSLRADGFIGGTDNTKDFTLGVGVAYGAKVLAPVINSSGVITSIPIDPNNKGVNYSGGLLITPYYGGPAINTVGALVEGTTSWSGYGNTSGGGISSVTTLSGGTGYNPNNPPTFYVGGTGTAATGFGTPTSNYGPIAIFGIPDDASILSILGIGDSIMSGYGSVDGTGDIYGNHGMYEKAIANRCGIMLDAVSGLSAGGWAQNNTKRMALYAYLENLGLNIDKFIVGLGTNDFNSNSNSDVISYVQNSVGTIITKIQSVWPNAKPITITIPPLTTTTDGGVTTANQTVWSVGFGGTPNYAASGRVSQYNDAIRNGSGITNQAGYIDVASVFADSTTPSKWRVSGEFYLSSASGVAFATPETVGATANTMIHPNTNVGIAYFVANADLTQLLQPIYERNTLVPKESYVATPYEVGAYGYRKVAAASAVSLTTATAANITSIVLESGNWEVWGDIKFVLSSATTTALQASTSRISATQGREEATNSEILVLTTTSGTHSLNIPRTRYSVPIGSTMTVYLVATGTFSAGTMTAYGTIHKKRM